MTICVCVCLYLHALCVCVSVCSHTYGCVCVPAWQRRADSVVCFFFVFFLLAKKLFYAGNLLHMRSKLIYIYTGADESLSLSEVLS